MVGVNQELKGVALDRTIVYPGGGGQSHDLGWLEASGCSVPIAGMQRAGGNLWHILDPAAGPLPSVGGAVSLRLDWERRYRLMRTHTAPYILCGLIFREYGARVTGGHMEPGQARMDFEFERMQAELVREIEVRINAEVAAARAVRVRILPRAEAFQIPDLIRTKINLLPEGIAEVRTWRSSASTSRPTAGLMSPTPPKWGPSASRTTRARGGSTSGW